MFKKTGCILGMTLFGSWLPSLHSSSSVGLFLQILILLPTWSFVAILSLFLHFNPKKLYPQHSILRFWSISSFLISAWHLQTQAHIVFNTHQSECDTGVTSKTTFLDIFGDILSLAMTATLSIIVLFIDIPVNRISELQSTAKTSTSTSTSTKPKKIKLTSISSDDSQPKTTNGKDEANEKLVALQEEEEEEKEELERIKQEEEERLKNQKRPDITAVRLKTNAESEANIFQRIIFSWVTPLLQKGLDKPLQKEDLFTLPLVCF